jgi:hypothetical protein
MKPCWRIILIMMFLLTACATAPVDTPTLTLQPTATAEPTITPTPQLTATTTPAPVMWSLEIPATPEACTNVIRSDTMEHTEEDIASLNAKIMEQKWFWDLPAGEFPQRTQQIMLDPWTEPPLDLRGTVPYSLARIVMWYNNFNADGTPIDVLITSCIKYKDGYVFGTFIDLNRQMVPVQIFIDPSILQNWVQASRSSHKPYEQRLLEDYQLKSSNTLATTLDLFGEFSEYPENKSSATGELGTYLENTYDYSNKIKYLFDGSADLTEMEKTIKVLQHIPLPGLPQLIVH